MIVRIFLILACIYITIWTASIAIDIFYRVVFYAHDRKVKRQIRERADRIKREMDAHKEG